MYYWLDEALTWVEARDRCSEGNNGYLAVAKSKKQFDFLRGMYDEYRARRGDAAGAWIDGKYHNATKTWVCDSYIYVWYPNYMSYMSWSFEEPNGELTEHCVLVWHSRTDGVANYRCNARMPAICATFR